MTKEVESAKAKRKRAWERLILAWGIALVPNGLAAAGVDPGGLWWLAICIALVFAFGVALLLWLAAVIQVAIEARRSRPRPEL